MASAFAAQCKSLLAVLASKSGCLKMSGKDLQLDTSCAIFVTMDSGIECPSHSNSQPGGHTFACTQGSGRTVVITRWFFSFLAPDVTPFRASRRSTTDGAARDAASRLSSHVHCPAGLRNCDPGPALVSGIWSQ